MGGPNQRWSMDFMSDQLATGQCLRILNIVDDYSRECVGQFVDFSISGERASRLLEQRVVQRWRRVAIVLDNGLEFAITALFLWSQRTGAPYDSSSRQSDVRTHSWRASMANSGMPA